VIALPTLAHLEVDPLVAARTAARALDDKQGLDIVVLGVGEALAVVEYFVIASGGSSPQVKALVDEAERQVADEHGVRPIWVEGSEDRTWVLMDYGSFAVHVFDVEARGFYALERLWSDAERHPWQATD